jgi:hypothetical protein
MQGSAPSHSRGWVRIRKSLRQEDYRGKIFAGSIPCLGWQSSSSMACFPAIIRPSLRSEPVLKRPSNALPNEGMSVRILLFGVLLILYTSASAVWGQEVTTRLPLLVTKSADLKTIFPPSTHPLIEAPQIERFLDELDGAPPEWATVYGHGHHDPGHDDRLFNLNRERDALREGKPALQWPVSFVWPGELSRYDSEKEGFSVAVGPKFNPTRWGIVRFKPEEVPSNLLAVPDAPTRGTLLRELENKQAIDIIVIMTGRLIPQESIVYDFSHDEEGVGLIMPVVRVERLDYVLVR